MGDLVKMNDLEALQDDRRRLLDYVLEVHTARGGKVQLPIGMTAPEPWLLDALDVQALLGQLQQSPQCCLDVLQCCRGTTRMLSAAVSRGRSTEDAGGLQGEGEQEAPLLHLPQLDTGLSEAEIKDLAYLVFASNCNQGTDEDLLSTVRSQLNIDAGRAAEVARLLALVTSTFSKMKDATGCLPVSGLWTANLELPVCLLGVVLPKDFNRFRSFVLWRDTLSHVLVSTLAASVREGWDQQPGSGSTTAQQLMARLKAALRRCDVRDADDYDEEEYRQASRAVGEHTYAIIKCVSAGWSFPWGLRVRLCEVLLRGVFDTLDETSYIDGADQYLQLLQVRLWPLLGISPSMHNAAFAWVHFRQFVVTRHPGLVAKTKALLRRLAQLARQQSNGSRSSSSGGGSSAGGAARPASNGGAAAADGPADSPQDAVLTREVGTAVIGWIAERLADYHARLSGLGGPESLPHLADVMGFAAASRGASQEQVGDMMAAAIRSSVEKELLRRIAAEGPAEDGAAACGTTCSVVRQLADEEVGTWASGFSGQLPQAAPLALAVLHAAAGARLLPWLSGIKTLDEPTCEVLRSAIELEPLLLAPITAAAAGCQHTATRAVLLSCRSWDIPSCLQPVLGSWVAAQTSGFAVWVERQLQQESWEPLGEQQPHSGSARELRRIVLESLEALFGLGLPLPAAIVSMHMEGVDSLIHKYLAGVTQQLGGWGDMVPPVPGLTRYKRELAVKQEEAESGMPGMPEQLPPLGTVSRKGLQFLQCVRRIEQEPCYEHIERLTPQVLVVMAASLGYLLDTLQPIANAVVDKWKEERARTTPRSSRHTGDHSSSSSGGAAARNPFMSPSPETQGGSGLWCSDPASGNGYSSTAAEDSWGGSWGAAGTGACQQQSLAAAAGGGGFRSAGGCHGGVAAQQRAEELFGCMLEAAAQSLRGSIAAVVKRLAVRVVWWQQRAGWCELLYRHRVTSCRIDWLLEGLADVLGGPVGLLPRGPRLQVAAALLQEAALGLERALLDGGPCRWFIPADVAHLNDDLDSLKRLFFAEGDGLQMQDINATLAGLTALLKLFAKPTGQLIEDHKTARRAALAAYGSTGNASNGAALGAAGPTGGVYTTGTSSKLQHQQQQQQQYGPLAANRMIAGGAGFAAVSAGPTGSSAEYSPRVTGGSGGGSGGGYSGSPRKGAATAAAAAVQTVMAIAAAGGDVGSQEHVLLKILCHRADHAASKYLKDHAKVPKARDETIGETLSRLTRIGHA